MDSKLILIQSIMLLYWESLLDTKTEGSADTIRTLVSEIKVPEGVLENDPSRDIIIGLKSTVLNLCALKGEGGIDVESLIQRLKINVKADPSLVSIITEGLIPCDDQVVIRKKCIEYSRFITEFNKERKFKDLIKKLTTDIVYARSSEPINVREVALSLSSELETFYSDNKSKGPMGIEGVVGLIDYSNRDSIKQTYALAAEETSDVGVMKTGWQAFNRMTGSHGGLRRGDFIVVGALQHNFKSGFTTTLTKQIALYNKPYMLNPNKKPLILHISSENALTDNLLFMHSSLRENETHEVCDNNAFTDEQITDYLYQKTSTTGYTLHMLRVNPSDFTFRSLFDLILQYEADGWEIHLLTIDYLNMFSKAGCDKSMTGSDVRDLFRRVRNFCSSRKITVITPHQISREATYLLRQGVNDFLAEIANKSYWDSCKTIDQEVDMEVYIHIEKVGDKSILSVRRGKHRKAGPVTPEKDLSYRVPFFEAGAIRDDINDKDLSFKVYGGKSDDPMVDSSESSSVEADWFA